MKKHSRIEMSNRVSSFPFLMFSDDHVKLLRTILRGSFIARSPNGPFFIRKKGEWISVDKDTWHLHIRQYIASCCKSYGTAYPDQQAISKAISFLYNENAHKRVYKSPYIANTKRIYAL